MAFTELATSEQQMDIREITSPTNSLLKVFRRALADGVTRDGLLAVEGPHLVEEALNATSAVVHSVLVSAGGASKFRGLLDRLPQHAEVAEVADRLFQKAALTENPQGIAALVELQPQDLASILAAKDTLLLVACGIQDPGNLGTMMRSAQAFGATALVTLKETVSPFNPKVIRSSAGAIFRLPVCPDLKSEQLFRPLRAAGVRLVAADRHSAVSLAGADLRGRLAILIGQEAAGLVL